MTVQIIPSSGRKRRQLAATIKAASGFVVNFPFGQNNRQLSSTPIQHNTNHPLQTSYLGIGPTCVTRFCLSLGQSQLGSFKL